MPIILVVTGIKVHAFNTGLFRILCIFSTEVFAIIDEVFQLVCIFIVSVYSFAVFGIIRVLCIYFKEQKQY